MPCENAAVRAALAVLLLCHLPAAAEDDAWARKAKEQCASMTALLEGYLGPKFKAPVPVLVKDADFIAPYVRQTNEKGLPKGMLETLQRVAVRLHQLPPGCDMVAQQIKLLEMGAAGLYDAEEDCFFVFGVAGPPGGPEFLTTLAHELVHAYRDVDTDYNARYLAAAVTDADWATGVQFLVEGDATLLGFVLGAAALQKRDPAQLMPAMLERSRLESRAYREMAAMPELAEFPLVVRESVIGPYAWGTPLAVLLYEKGGLQALADAYRQPPRSSEQVLHPGKYLGPEVDEPTVLEGGDPVEALGEGWRRVWSNVMGEFEIRVQLTERLGREAAERAAEGWDGSRYHYCEKEGVPAFFGMLTTWDREEDAREFAAAWALWAAKRDGRETAAQPGDEGFDVTTDEGLVVVRVKGKDVVVADGVPADRAGAVVAALARVQRAERKPDARPAGIR